MRIDSLEAHDYCAAGFIEVLALHTRGRTGLSGWDKFGAAVGGFAKLLVGLLWAAGGAFMFSQGQVVLGLIAVAYLIYLFAFGGRWLLY